MAATFMPLISKIAKTIKADFSDIAFNTGDDFYWSSNTNTIIHKTIKKESDLWLLLHEIAHSKLSHDRYDSDIQLVKFEALAWDYARKLIAPKYGLSPDYDFIEDKLDTYRLWLHKRSLCPKCLQTGLQKNENTYSCLNCRCSWQVNEARLCGLRRKSLRNSFTSATN